MAFPLTIHDIAAYLYNLDFRDILICIQSRNGRIRRFRRKELHGIFISRYLRTVQPYHIHPLGFRQGQFAASPGGRRAGSLLYDGQSHCLQAGDCVFIDCRKPYAQGSSEENLWSLKWAHFYGSSMNGIYEKYVERGGRPAFTPQEPALFASLLDCLLAIAGTEDYIRDMRINEKLTGLLTLLMAESWHPEAGSHIGGKKKSLQYVKTYLEEHYREKITLDRLAGQFYLNKFYLARTFKEQFGATVLGYLEQVRITRAKQLLRFSDLTAEAVGQEVGIGEPGYFCRVFKKVEGISPGEYRRMW